MASGLTLKAMRDEVRRYMEIVPLFDVTASAGDVGQPTTGQPDPNNTTINAAINEGLQAINRVVRVGALAEISVSVTAPSASYRGIYYADASAQIPNTLIAAEFLNVTYDDGAGNINRLEPYDYYAATKQKSVSQFQNYAPGAPRQWLATGHQIGIVPPPNTNGTLKIMTAGGLPPMSADTDVIALLPVEYQIGVVYFAVMLCSLRRASDAEAAQRAQMFGNLAMQTIMQVYQWKNGYEATGVESVRRTLEMIFAQPGQMSIPSVPFTGIAPSQQGQGQ